MSESRCWNCARLGECVNHSPDIFNDCEYFLNYKNVLLTTNDFSKYVKISKRQLYRNLISVREILQNLEKENNTKYCLFLNNKNEYIITDVRFLKRFIDYEEI